MKKEHVPIPCLVLAISTVLVAIVIGLWVVGCDMNDMVERMLTNRIASCMIRM